VFSSVKMRVIPTLPVRRIATIIYITTPRRCNFCAKLIGPYAFATPAASRKRRFDGVAPRRLYILEKNWTRFPGIRVVAPVVDIGIHDAIGPDPLSQINARFMIRFCVCTYVLVRPFVVQKSRTITATRIPGFRYLIS